MAEDEEWNKAVKEWLIDGGYNYAGFVAGKADCTIYGAACADSEEADKWTLIYAEPQERKIAISDEESKTVHVDETAVLWEVISEGNKSSYEKHGKGGYAKGSYAKGSYGKGGKGAFNGE